MGIKGISIFSDKEYSLHIDSREERWYAYYSHENDEYEEIHEDDGGYCEIGIKIDNKPC